MTSEKKPTPFSGVYYWKNSDGEPAIHLGEIRDRLLVTAIQVAISRVALLNPEKKVLTEYALRVVQATVDYVEDNPVTDLEDNAKQQEEKQPQIKVGDYL